MAEVTTGQDCSESLSPARQAFPSLPNGLSDTKECARVSFLREGAKSNTNQRTNPSGVASPRRQHSSRGLCVDPAVADRPNLTSGHRVPRDPINCH